MMQILTNQRLGIILELLFIPKDVAEEFTGNFSLKVHHVLTSELQFSTFFRLSLFSEMVIGWLVSLFLQNGSKDFAINLHVDVKFNF